MTAIIDLNPETYARHPIHGPGRCWTETNCYADVVIELIHALGHEPIAALPFTVCIDFEIDQWTFFKFPHADLFDLFGMEIQELNPWQSLHQHIHRQISGGRPILVEVDSFFLPDTSDTTYKNEHVKSTIAVNEFDLEKQHLGYFHGQGYYHLSKQDFQDLFQIDGPDHDRILPPYIELIKLHEGHSETPLETLKCRSLDLLRSHVSRLPRENPFQSFRQQFADDLNWLENEGIEEFHKYSFATIRQYGACFELSSTYFRWLTDCGEKGLAEIAKDFDDISNIAKTFQFKLARSLARK